MRQQTKFISIFFIIINLFLLSPQTFAAPKPAANLTPVGVWKTIDDLTGKPKSILQLSLTAQNTLQGKVIRIFPTEGQDQKILCTQCKGDKHNQPVVGMIILTGLKQAKDGWVHGEILDPHNGKTYRCTAQLVDNGNKLTVHGYVGLPLFGRSQVWERVGR
jgi:uncharacterized protein (DUF2147 family)